MDTLKTYLEIITKQSEIIEKQTQTIFNLMEQLEQMKDEEKPTKAYVVGYKTYNEPDYPDNE